MLWDGTRRINLPTPIERPHVPVDISISKFVLIYALLT